jgi:hypothetical protein
MLGLSSAPRLHKLTSLHIISISDMIPQAPMERLMIR